MEPRSRVPAIGPRDVALFLARPESLLAPGRREEALATLAPEERERLARFRDARDRDVALASRALQRRVLARCADVATSELRFRLAAHGRPELAAPAAACHLRFNVANTRGLVACAVTVGRAIGVDVEPVPEEAPRDVVDGHFAAAERASLWSLPPAARPRRFAELWTLKEAYLKACGLGLAGSLERVRFDFAPAGPALALDPALGDAAELWQVRSFAPTAAHIAALCVRRAPAPLSIEIRWEDEGDAQRVHAE